MLFISSCIDLTGLSQFTTKEETLERCHQNEAVSYTIPSKVWLVDALDEEVQFKVNSKHYLALLDGGNEEVNLCVQIKEVQKGAGQDGIGLHLSRTS